MCSPSRRILRIVENRWSRYNTRLWIWFTSSRLNLSTDYIKVIATFFIIYTLQNPNFLTVYLLILRFLVFTLIPFSVLLFLDYANRTTKAEYVLLTCTTYKYVSQYMCVYIYIYIYAYRYNEVRTKLTSVRINMD